jgi:outer membrane protein assembly factor BamB
MKHARLFLVSALVLAVLSLAAVAPAGAEQAGDALISAAQRQDVAKVTELLAAGTPVDSANRYGATALFYAADKGNVELVKLLLAAGADTNVQDTFYNATPLGWSLFKMGDSPPHREVVLLLLAHGGGPVELALTAAGRAEDLELLQAVLATGTVSEQARRSALNELAGSYEPAQEPAAEGAEAEDGAPADGTAAARRRRMAELLAEGLPALSESEQAPGIELTAEQRARYVGEYANEPLGMNVKVFVEGDALKAQAVGQPMLTLVPTGVDTFAARELDGLAMAFAGRGGLVERFMLTQGGQEFGFERVEVQAEASELAVAPPLPKAERTAPIQWPSFRGPNASGIGDGQGVPTEWDAASGKNIRWKTPIPGVALASPVIWGDRVFIVTSTSEAEDQPFRTGLYGDVDSVEDDSLHVWRVYALDKATGEILWQHDASRGVPKVKRHFKSSHANPTPAVDGSHLVVLFPSEGLYCYDHAGELLWKKELGVFGSGWFFDSTYEWGFAASPILHDGRVILQADIYSGSFLAAWDVATGELAWRTERDEVPTWSTPSILPPAEPGGRAEIVTNGTTVRGYDAETGQELWTLTPNSEIVVGTPVVAGGLAYVTGGYPPARPIYAIRPGGHGDLTLADDAQSSAQIAWRDERGGTYIPTPIVYDGILYMLHNNGRLAAYDAATGESIYRQRVGEADSFAGSAVAADGRLYFTSETGTTYVVRSGRVFAELAANELDEVVMSTPAISDGLLVIRGMDHVYGIGVAGEAVEESAEEAAGE